MKFKLVTYIFIGALYIPEWVYGRKFLLNVLFGYLIINSMAQAQRGK